MELKRANVRLHRDSAFFQDVRFKKRFSALSIPVPKPEGPPEPESDELEKNLPPDLRAKLREVAFSESHWKCWRPDRVSTDTDDYSCHNPRATFKNISLSEAAAMKLQAGEEDIIIVNAEDSAFAPLASLNILKSNTQQSVSLNNAGSIKAVRQWIADRTGVYDPASVSAPKDFQTILEKDSTRFERTNSFWNVAGKDRRIFKEKATGQRFYVDEGHPGPSAHLEVFDADGKHVGEADINTGVVDTSKCVSGRGIKV